VFQEHSEQPGGNVPTTSSPELRVGVVRAISRSRRLRPIPRKIRIQSRLKKMKSTVAVARCVATRKVRKYLSF
jgi:hypothetical protein